MLDLQSTLPTHSHTTIYALAEQFHAAHKQFYLVGGIVRNALLQRESTDIDCTTDAVPGEIRHIVQSTHPDALVMIGERFGTIRLLYGSDAFEITTFRNEAYDPGSRKPVVTFGTSLAEDLARRDFTINALAYDPLTQELVDLFHGADDLAEKLIRAVGDDPDKRFLDDPLRLMRAVRFAMQLGFTIEPSTYTSMQRCADSLQTISHERIRDEMNKILLSPSPSQGVRLLVDAGLMVWSVPEVLALKGTGQQSVVTARHKDVYEHVLRVVERSPARLATRWAALLHDIAKPITRSVEQGQVRFFGHEDTGARMTKAILRNLRFDSPFIKSVSTLVRLHMRANSYTDDWTDGAVRRLTLDAGDALEDLLDLSKADISSYREEKVLLGEQRVEALRARIQHLREESRNVPPASPLDGQELMQLFHRPAGPWLKSLKEYLLNLVVDGELAQDDKAAAEALALHFIEEHPEVRGST